MSLLGFMAGGVGDGMQKIAKQGYANQRLDKEITARKDIAKEDRDHRQAIEDGRVARENNYRQAKVTYDRINQLLDNADKAMSATSDGSVEPKVFKAQKEAQAKLLIDQAYQLALANDGILTEANMAGQRGWLEQNFGLGKKVEVQDTDTTTDTGDNQGIVVPPKPKLRSKAELIKAFGQGYGNLSGVQKNEVKKPSLLDHLKAKEAKARNSQPQSAYEAAALARHGSLKQG